MKKLTLWSYLTGIWLITWGIYASSVPDSSTKNAVPWSNTAPNAINSITSAPPIKGLQKWDMINVTIDQILETKPTVKQRIQWTRWYRDFTTWRLSREITESYIAHASYIEDILAQHPWILSAIQYTEWWGKYIRWETPPPDMLNGNIRAYLYLEKLKQQHPFVLEKASNHPQWDSWIQYGTDFIVVGQKEFMISVLLRLEFLDTHPEVESLMKQNGYTRDNLFTDNWSQNEGIYGFLNEIQDSEEKN